MNTNTNTLAYVLKTMKDNGETELWRCVSSLANSPSKGAWLLPNHVEQMLKLYRNYGITQFARLQPNSVNLVRAQSGNPGKTDSFIKMLTIDPFILVDEL